MIKIQLTGRYTGTTVTVNARDDGLAPNITVRQYNTAARQAGLIGGDYFRLPLGALPVIVYDRDGNVSSIIDAR